MLVASESNAMNAPVVSSEGWSDAPFAGVPSVARLERRIELSLPVRLRTNTSVFPLVSLVVRLDASDANAPRAPLPLIDGCDDGPFAPPPAAVTLNRCVDLAVMSQTNT